MNVPNEFNRRYEPTMYCHTARVPVRVTQITEKIDRKNGKEMEK
jgi:translation elongation factor EF-1alpha